MQQHQQQRVAEETKDKLWQLLTCCNISGTRRHDDKRLIVSSAYCCISLIFRLIVRPHCANARRMSMPRRS